MHCPFCVEIDTKVIDSRLVGDGAQVRRRRECPGCTERFTTFEAAELVLPQVVKRDGRRMPFDVSCLRRGMQRALEKRPVSTNEIENKIEQVLHDLRALGEREIPTAYLGERVMFALKSLDHVAYVRFASVYRSFQDIDEFHEEIQRLRDEKNKKNDKNKETVE